MDSKLRRRIRRRWKECVTLVTRAHVLGDDDEAFRVWAEALHDIFKATGDCRCDDTCWMKLEPDAQRQALSKRQYSYAGLIAAIDQAEAILATTRAKH